MRKSSSLMSTRTLVTVAAVVVGALVATQTSHAGDKADPEDSVIEFLTRPKNDTGVFVCALFDKSGWLTKPVKPAWGKIKDKRGACVFRDLRSGT